MITIFNRKELFLTFNMNERVRICDILSANDIDHYTKTVNATNTLGGGRRGYTGSLGVNMDCAYEYHIYVHKKDYDRAAHLINSRR